MDDNRKIMYMVCLWKEGGYYSVDDAVGKLFKSINLAQRQADYLNQELFGEEIRFGGYVVRLASISHA